MLDLLEYTTEILSMTKAYVTQADILLGTLTVKETLIYSAKLRLPRSLNNCQVNQIVDETIMEMGLQDCANNVIGNWHSRGISGGEKKRLSIALEILTRPTLLFLDEPTSGLDSASAFFVIQTLRSMAREANITIVSSVHQPSSEVFALLDDLFLLSCGETVFFGEAKMALKDRKTIPTTHTLTAEIKAMLVHKYKSSEYATTAVTGVIATAAAVAGFRPSTATVAVCSVRTKGSDQAQPPPLFQFRSNQGFANSSSGQSPSRRPQGLFLKPQEPFPTCNSRRRRIRL